ncbi:ParA family protein [Halomarina ordinaria]|uniref:ParA family protein n=1 Tax=Halomarina ordinaria TaxID=3033939 RepID=A0ABD5UDF1_9EURY|nr:ParA family protein [Halomarina sp. PSRA2]
MAAMRAALFLDKGGVGKTTGTAHLGTALEKEGYRTLLIDLAGKQGDLSKHFGLWEELQAEDRWPNIATTFQDEWSIVVEKLDSALEDLIIETEEGPDIIPAHGSLDGLDAVLANIDEPAERYGRLDAFLTEYVDDDYDVILLDLPGSTSNIAYNGLWAARNVIAPVRPGPFEAGQAAQLRQDLDDIHEEQGVTIELTMVLLNEVDERTKAGRRYLEEFASEYPDAIAPAQIPSSQDIQNAQMDGTVLWSLERPSKTAQRAMAAYEEDARALIARLGGGN